MRCDPHGRATLCGAHLFGLKLATRNDARCVAVALGNWTAPPCEPPQVAGTRSITPRGQPNKSDQNIQLINIV